MTLLTIARHITNSQGLACLPPPCSSPGKQLFSFFLFLLMFIYNTTNSRRPNWQQQQPPPTTTTRTHSQHSTPPRHISHLGHSEYSCFSRFGGLATSSHFTTDLPITPPHSGSCLKFSHSCDFTRALSPSHEFLGPQDFFTCTFDGGIVNPLAIVGIFTSCDFTRAFSGCHKFFSPQDPFRAYIEL